MTTVVNNPNPVATDSGGNGMLVGVIALIGFAMVFVYFGIPALRSMNPVQINLPTTQVVIPDKINVNVNQGK